MTPEQIRSVIDQPHQAGVIKDLRGANLWGANLRDADLRDADLRRANLRGADLRSANLTGANLIDADLIGADLIGAILIDADLRGADLRSANLHDANLAGADLRSANLYCADLTGADLAGSWFSDANLTQVVGVVWAAVGPIGQDRRTSLAVWQDGEVIHHAGCFRGNRETYLKQIEAGGWGWPDDMTARYAAECRAAIEWCEASIATQLAHIEGTESP